MKTSITRWIPRLGLFVGTILITSIGLLAYTYWEVEQESQPYIYRDVVELDQYDVGLVLGTSRYLVEGGENAYFTYRINAAEELYRRDIIRKILVSGDNREVSYNEPKAMQDALIERGIPQEDIVLDYAGIRTLDSVVRAREVFGQSEYLVISQHFHVKSAIYIGRQYGINIRGYFAEDVPVENSLRIQIREVFARAQAWVDVTILEEQPKFLGDEIDIDNPDNQE